MSEPERLRLTAEDIAATDGRVTAPPVLTIGPVSYTHLRAHETVLDLVCRLLLEKKKSNKQNTAIASHQREMRSRVVRY